MRQIELQDKQRERKKKRQNKLFYSVSIKTFHFSLESSNDSILKCKYKFRRTASLQLRVLSYAENFENIFQISRANRVAYIPLPPRSSF